MPKYVTSLGWRARGGGNARAINLALRPPGFPRLERSLVCAGAAPAASLPVAVQVCQNVAPLAGSPSLDERGVESPPEGGSVALDLVGPGHVHTVLPGSEARRRGPLQGSGPTNSLRSGIRTPSARQIGRRAIARRASLATGACSTHARALDRPIRRHGDGNEKMRACPRPRYWPGSSSSH